MEPSGTPVALRMPLHIRSIDVSRAGKSVVARSPADDTGNTIAVVPGLRRPDQESIVFSGLSDLVTRVRFADEDHVGWLEYGDTSLHIGCLDDGSERRVDVGEEAVLGGSEVGLLTVSGPSPLVVDATTGRLEWLPDGTGRRAIAVDPAGETLVVADEAHVVGYERRSGQRVFDFPLDVGAEPDQVSVSRGAARLAVRASTGLEEIVVYDCRSGARLVEDLYAATASVARVSPTGRLLALAYSTGVVHWADLESGESGLEECGEKVTDVAFMPDETVLVACRPEPRRLHLLD